MVWNLCHFSLLLEAYLDLNNHNLPQVPSNPAIFFDPTLHPSNLIVTLLFTSLFRTQTTLVLKTSCISYIVHKRAPMLTIYGSTKFALYEKWCSFKVISFLFFTILFIHYSCSSRPLCVVMIRFNVFLFVFPVLPNEVNASKLQTAMGNDNMKKCHNFDEKWAPFNVYSGFRDLGTVPNGTLF